MSEENKNVEKTEQEAKATELSQQELDKFAGGQDCASPKLHDSASPLLTDEASPLLDTSSPKLY